MAQNGNFKEKFKQNMNHYLKEAQNLSKFHLTIDEIAELWGISRRTLFRYMKEFPELKKAIERGRLEAKKSVMRAMFEAMKRGNATLIIFYLINRYPEQWKDIRNIRVTGEEGGTLKVEFVPAKKQEKKEGESESDKG